MELVFDWDENKARRNRDTHKVSFNEARTVFNDPFLVTFPDEYHSHREQRFISLGTSLKNRIILVVHTEDEENGAIVIRLISARRATTSERKAYEEKKA
jgi:uncharacterized DUF497 family protein